MLFERISRTVFSGFQPEPEAPKAVLPFHPVSSLPDQGSLKQEVSEAVLLRRRAAKVMEAVTESRLHSSGEEFSCPRSESFNDVRNWGGHIAAKAMQPVIPVPALTPSGQKLH